MQLPSQPRTRALSLLQQCASRQNDSNQNLHTNEVYGTPLVWWSRSLGPSSSRDYDDTMIRISVPPRNRGWITTGWIGLAFLLAGHVTALGPLVTRGLLSDWSRSAIREFGNWISKKCEERMRDRSCIPLSTCHGAREPLVGAADREWSSSLLTVGDPREYSSSVLVAHFPLRIYTYIFHTRFAVNRRVVREPRKWDRTLDAAKSRARDSGTILGS